MSQGSSTQLMNILASIKHQLVKRRHQIVVLLFLFIALPLAFLPLQHYITLSRNQHCGMVIGLIGVGYLLQTALSWREIGPWARACNLVTGIFFASIGVLFIQYSWLDPKNGAITDEQEAARNFIAALYAFFSLIIGGMWLVLAYKDVVKELKAEKPQ
jgi:hypothetical protein